LQPVALLIHVPDVEKGYNWYRKAFPDAISKNIEGTENKLLELDGFSIEVVKSDLKVSSGKCGTVLYWSTNSFSDFVTHLKELGAKMYRGPIRIEKDMSMCQLEDPFGNLIGLRGKDS